MEKKPFTIAQQCKRDDMSKLEDFRERLRLSSQTQNGFSDKRRDYPIFYNEDGPLNNPPIQFGVAYGYDRAICPVDNPPEYLYEPKKYFDFWFCKQLEKTRIVLREDLPLNFTQVNCRNIFLSVASDHRTGSDFCEIYDYTCRLIVDSDGDFVSKTFFEYRRDYEKYKNLENLRREETLIKINPEYILYIDKPDRQTKIMANLLGYEDRQISDYIKSHYNSAMKDRL